jgi:4-hydroxy 2-oxovalerate aldolase
MNKISLLDCTLRDGSYVVDYQFNSEDNFVIAKALSDSGTEYIEVGHGLGLDAQNISNGLGIAREKDITYVETAVEAVNGQSKIGSFFIPNIGNTASISKMADAGLNFIRIGINPNEYKIAEESIKIAKEKNLEISCNLMKSYTVSEEELSKNCSILEEMGANIVYLVDSAGGMTPSQVKNYIQAIKDSVSIEIGFHAHNNLNLAEANCLAAVEAGATFIDGTLRGIGRSAGNPATEILANILIREGYGLGKIDPIKLLEVAESLIPPLLPVNKGLQINEIVSGLSMFHSGFQNKVDNEAKKLGIPSHRIILEMGGSVKDNTSSEAIALSAKKAFKKYQESNEKTILFNHQKGFTWRNKKAETIDSLFLSIIEIVSKTGHTPIITVSRGDSKYSNIHITPIHVGGNFCIGHIESSSEKIDNEIFTKLQSNPMILILDTKIQIDLKFKETLRVFFYNEYLLTLDAVNAFIRTIPDIKSFYLVDIEKHKSMHKGLGYFSKFSDVNADLGIALSHTYKFDIQDVNKIKTKGSLLLVKNNSVTNEALELARKRNINLYRLDFSEALIAEVFKIVGSYNKYFKKCGRRKVEDFHFVAGGFLGKKGDIVVDSLEAPSLMFGISDGFGSVLPFEEVNKNIKNQATKWIIKNKLNFFNNRLDNE